MNPFTPSTLAALARQFGTPLWVYDAATITQRIASLMQFDVVRFAQKANSNTHILRLMRSQGVAVDAVSLGEIERALAAGFQPGFQGGQGHAERWVTRRPQPGPRLIALVPGGKHTG